MGFMFLSEVQEAKVAGVNVPKLLAAKSGPAPVRGFGGGSMWTERELSLQPR